MKRTNFSLFAILLILSSLFFLGCNSKTGNTTESRTATPLASIIPTQTKPPPTVTQTPPIAPTPTLGAGSITIRESDGMPMVFVPEGEFIMGADREDYDQAAIDACYKGDGWGEENCEALFIEEGPKHTVYLDTYWIDQYEIQNAQFAKFLNTFPFPQTFSYLPSWFKKEDINPKDFHLSQENDKWKPDEGFEDHPVNYVNWLAARDYCEWVGARLPTEAEWEKAARGTEGAIYPWDGDDFNCALTNLKEKHLTGRYTLPGAPNCGEINETYPDTAPVGSFPLGVSPYGAYDMIGNVHEWVYDYFNIDYYKVSPSNNPTGPETGQEHTSKGASHNFRDYWWARSSTRIWSGQANRAWPGSGFRCASSTGAISPFTVTRTPTPMQQAKASPTPGAHLTATPALNHPVGDIVYHERSDMSEYSYLSYVPDTLPKDEKVYIVIEPDFGQYNDQSSCVEAGTAQNVEFMLDAFSHYAEEHGYVFLFPIIPTNCDGRDFWVLHMSNYVFTDPVDTPFYRPDLKLNANIDALQELLRKDGYIVNDKVFMFGFSNGGLFSNRYTLLHPERVEAIAAGGTAGEITMPEEEIDGVELKWFLGTSELESLTGKPFNRDKYLKVPQFNFMGDLDLKNYHLREGCAVNKDNNRLNYCYWVDYWGEDMVSAWRNQCAYLQNLG
ncbi:MAG: SUMF1/EgtB/PvdO family nonheme iron enzyme, partial [Anaerolineae bacterium]|nr:SUMF1/EgtB/PvdO family nonheme iron enzyme [Anaerolineae bacterium]